MGILTIKNFGPIKDVELDIRKTTVLIGEQASGKSTVAKLMEIALRQLVKKEGFDLESISEELRLYNIHNYANNDSDFSFNYEIDKKKDFFDITPLLKNSMKDYDRVYEIMKSKNIKGNLFIEDFQNSFKSFYINFIRQYFIYIPTERHLISTLADQLFRLLQNDVIAPKFLSKFGAIFQEARQITTQLGFYFLPIFYTNENNQDYIVINDNKRIKLSESASGYQALIPLLLVTDFKVITNIEDVPLNNIFTIEEPELNLFPTMQKNVIEYFAKKIINRNNSLFITTHSPYILSSFNNLLYAYTLAKKFPDKKGEIAKIIPEERWVNPDEFNAYYLADGTARPIFDRDRGLISENELDGVSEDIGDEFDQLLHIRRESE